MGPGHVDLAGLPEFLCTAFSAVLRTLGAQGFVLAGTPFARYLPGADGFDVEAGFPTSEPLVPAGRVVVELLPGGPTATVLHRGACGAVAAAYDAATSWLADNGYVPAGESLETSTSLRSPSLGRLCTCPAAGFAILTA